jgi:DNA-binding transcriptional MerR regulator
MVDFVPIPTNPSAATNQTFVPSPANKQDQQFYDDTAIGEVGEGIVSGVIGIGEGLLGLGATAVDLIADTDYGTKVTESAEALRDTLGLDPEGFLGKGAEIVTQFVVPGIGAAAKAGKLVRAARTAAGKTGPMTKAERFGLAAAELGAAGLADAVVVSSSNMSTIGDWVGAGPTQTDELIGLRGRERALADLTNRAKIGAESVLLGGVAQAALTAGGKSLGQLQVTKDLAQATNRKLDATGEYIDNLLYRRMTAAPGSADDPGAFGKTVAEIIAFVSPRGYLPGQIADKRLGMEGIVGAEMKKAERVLNRLEKEIDVAIKNAPAGSGNLDRVDIMSRLEAYLTEADPAAKAKLFNGLPQEIRGNAVKMRQHVDDLIPRKSDFLAKNNFVTADGRKIKDVIDEGVGSYLRRRYRVFEDAKYTPTEESKTAADNFFKANRRSTEKELTELARRDIANEIFTPQFMQANGLTKVGAGDTATIQLGAKVTDEAAKTAREGFLGKYSIKARERLEGGRVAKDRLELGMFVSRENIPKTLRALLGEVDDPREAYLGTIADLAQFSAVDDYYSTIAQMAKQNSGIGKLFVDGSNLSAAQQQVYRDRGYVKLGGSDGKSSTVGLANQPPGAAEALLNRMGWGALDNYFVPAPIWRDLTNQVLAEDSIGATAFRGLFSTFLRAKAISQYSKTVLSPITQVRNFTTAIAFSLANGNVPIIGRGGSLTDAAKAVFSNVTTKGSDAVFDDMLDAQRRGVMGTSAQLREIQDALSKGIGMTTRAPRNVLERVPVVGEKLAKGVGAMTKPFEKAYQASDDFWKYYSYNAEQAKIRHALRGQSQAAQYDYLTKNGTDIPDAMKGGKPFDLEEAIKYRSAQIVRDTVPNYTKGASAAVQFGRKLPVGNFITFPAEMFRTSFNIMKQSLDDMASNIPEIQARGRQRLLGFTTTAAVIPASVAGLGSSISGVSQDEMDAYKRSFGADWEKGAVLVPIGKTEDGKLQYFNFSTSNPYDILFRSANRFVDEVENAAAVGKDPGQAAFDVMVGSLGEFFAPFLSESIITEALVDITLRDGRTPTGARVYNPQDDLGTKGQKMFMHVMDTLAPGLSPFNVSGGELEAGRFARGVFGGISPELVDPEDKMGRVRDIGTELFRAVSGVTPQEFDPKKGLEFGAFRLNQAQTEAKSIFNSKTDDFNATGQDLLDAYVAANQSKFRIDREYRQMIEDLRALGMKENEIRKVLKQNNIGGAKGVLQDRFEPFDVTPKNFQEMRRSGTIEQFPRQQIQEIQKSMRGMSLDQGPMDVEPTAPGPTFVPSPAQPEPTFVPSPVQQGSVAPNIQTQPRPPGPVNPALLGSNPMDQASNAQIAARLQGS